MPLLAAARVGGACLARGFQREFPARRGDNACGKPSALRSNAPKREICLLIK